jgi:hypothetical protein
MMSSTRATRPAADSGEPMDDNGFNPDAAGVESL